MGIDGLLKNVKKCMQEKNLEEYRGQRAAVDTYAWLHKIIKGPSGRQIVCGKDQRKYVNDCLRRVQKITKVGIDLTLVFDGGALPRKLKEEEARLKRREQNFLKGKQLMASGNYEQGLKKMIDSIDVSPDVAFKLIQELKARGIKFMIAPYEADAQLAYLSRTGIVDFIITEDSDLLAFGAKKILYKLDFSTLNGEEICLENIKHEPETGFNWFSHNMFLSTCIMAGCDYLSQIKGVGMKLAQKLISKNHTLKKSLVEVSQQKQIPEFYEQDFMKAMLTFRFQRVYCPLRKICVSVNEMSPSSWRSINQIKKTNFWSEEVMDLQMLEYALKLSVDQNSDQWQFLGKKLSDETARQVAEGEINPITLEAYDASCLQKLRYDCQNMAIIPKKTSTFSVKETKTATSSILKYCKPIDKKNPFDLKSLGVRSISEQEYKVYHKEEKSNKAYFPITELNKKDPKKSLRFNDEDSDEEQFQQISVISDNRSIELIESSQSPVIYSSCEEIKSVQTVKSGKTNEREYRNRLEEISETMFGKIFSEEFLRSPFSC